MIEPKVIKPQPGPQTDFASCEADICIYGGAAFGGKLQSVDATVFTPFGSSRMGCLKVGSQVSNPDGSVAKVIAIHPQGVQQLYKVTCADGAVCEVGLEHLWKFRVSSDRRFRKKPKAKMPTAWYIGTTETIIKKIGSGKRILIPLASPVKFTIPERNSGFSRPVDPYTLGVLLGDGSLSMGNVTICSPDESIIDRLSIKHTSISNKVDNKAKSYRYASADIIPQLTQLGLMGKRSWEKSIPETYKYAPLHDRYELLKGLFDTDGTVGVGSRISYTTVSEVMAKDIQWILRSLGFCATITNRIPKYTYKGEKKEGRRAYTIYVHGKDGRDIFTLKKKYDRCKPPKRVDRRITSIEKSHKAECQCITVDNPNGLYITDDFIVTHNSFSMLLEPLRAIHHSRFNGVVFRRERPQITAGGGLWDTSGQIYQKIGGKPVSSRLQWRWENGAIIQFTHLQLERDKFSHHSAQYVFIGFDELEFFTESQFWYLWTRNRPPSGYKGRCWMRAATNPNADSWIRMLIDWWIGEDGYAIKDRCGVLKWFTRVDGKVVWVDKDWVGEDGIRPKSFTFIHADIDDNKIGTDADPSYRANLHSQDMVTRERLLRGNWNISHKGGMFKPEWFKMIDESELPTGLKYLRYWDFAATPLNTTQSNNPDWTVGTLIGYNTTDIYVIDVNRFRESPLVTNKKVRQSAEVDGKKTTVSFEEEKGSSGKFTSMLLKKNTLKGFDVIEDPVTGDKITRAKPLASLAEDGHVHIVRGIWNRTWLTEFGSFPLNKKDQVDSLTGAFKMTKMRKRVWAKFNRDSTDCCTKINIKWQNYNHYAGIYLSKSMDLHILTAVWMKYEHKLLVYGELIGPHLSINGIASRIVRGMNFSARPVHGLYGNSEMFASGKDTASVLNAEIKNACREANTTVRATVRQPMLFERTGAITQANLMFHNKEIIVEESCKEAVSQFSTWGIEDNKPQTGFNFCEALLLIISEVSRLNRPQVTKTFADKHYRPVKPKKTLKTKLNSYQVS